MGKKRVATKAGAAGEGTAQSGANRLAKKRIARGIVHIEATFNNTKLALSDLDGKVVLWSSSGTLGFKGAKKGTPFAAAKVGEHVGDLAKGLGLAEIDVVVKGVGSGRESAIRGFIAKSGANIATITDKTPVPFNGPRPPKPRRV